MSLNIVCISGNLTREPELSSTQSGLSILNFGMAVNDRRKNRDGEWEDYANFVDCKLFGRRAEALAPKLGKGMKVCVKGKLHYSSWEDRNTGQRRSKLEVMVDDIELMTKSSQQPSQVYEDFGGAALYSDDEIPF